MIENLTIRQIKAYRKHFSKNPPIEFVVPHYLGYYKAIEEKNGGGKMKPTESLPDVED